MRRVERSLQLWGTIMANLSRNYYTTGEAADLLGLSASTVIRKFDKGELAGKRHPVTGKRMVERGSIEQFLDSHNLPSEEILLEKRRVLIADETPAEGERLRLLLSRDRDLTVERVTEGCEVCGQVVSWQPHIAFINTNLPDMRGRDVVRSLRRLPLSVPLYIALITPQGVTVPREELEELDVDAHFPKPWRGDGLRRRARVMLGLDEETRVEGDHFEQRRWPRMRTDWPARVELRVDDEHGVVDVGRARIRDISEGGAFLYDLVLERGALPAKPFTLDVKISEGRAAGFEARARPVRLDTNGRLGLGVRFDELDPEKLKRLREASQPAADESENLS